MTIVSVNVFETKFSIQLDLRQFLFEVNRTSIRGEILKNLCASHHASTYISEKSCFRLRQKNNPLTCRCNFYSPYSKKNVYHSSASKFFYEKRHSCEFFTKNDNFVKKSVKFSVKKFYQFCVQIVVEIFIHVFMCWKELSNNISDRSEA